MELSVEVGGRIAVLLLTGFAHHVFVMMLNYFSLVSLSAVANLGDVR